MATKIICDGCGREMGAGDAKTFDFGEFTVSFHVQSTKPGALGDNADFCRRCLADAAKSRDDRKPAPWFPWLVWMKGVKSPGPHAGFEYQSEAERFLATWPEGGEIRKA